MGFADNLKKLATQAADGIQKIQELAEEQQAKQGQQQNRQSHKQAEADAEEQAEIKALPTAQVQLTASGWASGSWSGELHYGWNEISADEHGKKLLWLELFAPAGQEPTFDGHRLRHWSFQIYGWAEDGTYDLAQICRDREAGGWNTDYLEWAMTFADAEDMTFFFTPDTGPGTVTVSEAGKRFSVSITGSGAYGDLTLAAQITRD